MPALPKTTSKEVKKYIEEVLHSASRATIDRKLSSLKKFFTWAEKEGHITENPVPKYLGIVLQKQILEKFSAKPRIQKALYQAFYVRPGWYKRYHTLAVSRYINFAVLIIFAAGMGVGIYEQFIKKPTTPLAFPTALARPNRYLSFQGRLTDNLGNPVTSATNLVFKLYDAASAGTTLWNSSTCSITPDQDGIFSSLLGSDCGGELTSDIFSENADVWLGITIGVDTEATPRIQIATVAYALNAETLQGYPASASATINTIPVINNSGQLVIAASSPKIQSTTGTFAIEGQALTIQTPNTSDGSITINPDGTGTLNLTFEGSAPGGSAGGFINATNANITSGALYFGQVASNASGYNLIELKSGATPTTKFSVDSAGNTTVAGTFDPANIAAFTLTGNLTVAQDIDILPAGTTGTNDIGSSGIPFDNIYAVTIYQNNNQVCDASGNCTTGNEGPWTVSSSVVYPDQATYRVGIGTVTTADVISQFYLTNGSTLGKALAILNQTEDQPILTASASGTTKFTLTNTGNLISVAGAKWLPASDSTTALNIANSSGTSFVTFDTTNSRVGIGTTGPGSLLDVRGAVSSPSSKFLNIQASSGGTNAIYNEVINTGGTFRFGVDDSAGTGLLASGGQAYGSLIGSVSNTDLQFITNNLARVTIQNDGNLGIGTTGPSQQLEITKNFRLPATTGSTVGVIMSGASRFIHNYGTDNLFAGVNSGNFTMSGGQNAAVGAYTLDANTTGYQNMALGYSALSQNTEGADNVAIGATALFFLTTGVRNTAVGSSALYSNISGSSNVAIGGWAGLLLTSNSNTLIGYQAGDNLTTGAHNIVIGQGIDAPAADSTNTLNIGNLIFATGLDGTGTTLSTGNVGIGTTGPSEKLHISGNLAADGVDQILENTNATGYTRLLFYTDAGLLGAFQAIGSNYADATIRNAMEFVGIGTNSDVNMIVQGSGRAFNVMDGNRVARLTVKESGNVGIGTTGPTAKLQVFGGGLTVGDTVDALTGNVRITGDYKFAGVSTHYIQNADNSDIAFKIWNGAADVVPMTIKPSGNVGIGTTSPSQKLAVIGNCVAADTLLPIRRRKKKKKKKKYSGAGPDPNPDIPNGELYDYLLCRIDEVMPGDEVLSLNEATGALEHARINALMDMGVKEVYELTTKSGRKIRTTGEHPYLVQA